MAFEPNSFPIRPAPRASAIGRLDSTEHRVGVLTFQRYRQLVNDFIVPEIGALRADAVRAAHVEAGRVNDNKRQQEN